MSPRILGILALVVIALVALYVIGSREPESPAEPAWMTFDTAAIRTVYVRNAGQGELFLARDGAQWKGFEDTREITADTGQVEEIFTMLLKLTSFEVVSDSPGKYGMFALDTTYEMLIRLNDTPATVIHAGRQGPQSEFTYMRRGDEAEVWAVKGFEGWRVYRFFPSPPPQ